MRRSVLLRKIVTIGILIVTLQITVYIGKRDFIDYLTRTDPVGESAARSY